MAAAAADKVTPSGVVGILTRKRGPLPMWAWLVIGLGLLLLVMYFRGGSGAPDASEAPGSEPGDQLTPPAVWIVPQTQTPTVIVSPPTTVPTAPPGGGRPSPAGTGRPSATLPGNITLTRQPLSMADVPPGSPSARGGAASTTSVPATVATPADLARILNSRPRG